jgi:hypothetical protein
VAVVVTLIQTKQIVINIHKRNSTKTVETIQKKAVQTILKHSTNNTKNTVQAMQKHSTSNTKSTVQTIQKTQYIQYKKHGTINTKTVQTIQKTHYKPYKTQ